MENDDDKNRKEDKIAKALSIPPMENLKRQLMLPESGKFADIDIAKENIKEMINKGSEAFDELLEIAKQSQHPRAFEVLANLMRTVVDANKDLVDINVRENNIKVFNDNRQVQQNFFYGTTKDMLKQLKGTDNEETGPVIDNEEIEDGN